MNQQNKSEGTTPQAERPAPAWEKMYRQLLWESHAGYTHSSYLYGDDGEMQCNHRDCMLDFKRELPEALDAHIWKMNLKRLAEARAVAPVETPYTAEQFWNEVWCKEHSLTSDVGIFKFAEAYAAALDDAKRAPVKRLSVRKAWEQWDMSGTFLKKLSLADCRIIDERVIAFVEAYVAGLANISLDNTAPIVHN